MFQKKNLHESKRSEHPLNGIKGGKCQNVYFYVGRKAKSTKTVHGLFAVRSEKSSRFSQICHLNDVLYSVHLLL